MDHSDKHVHVYEELLVNSDSDLDRSNHGNSNSVFRRVILELILVT